MKHRVAEPFRGEWGLEELSEEAMASAFKVREGSEAASGFLSAGANKASWRVAFMDLLLFPDPASP
jgi:hypothetical protein